LHWNGVALQGAKATSTLGKARGVGPFGTGIKARLSRYYLFIHGKIFAWIRRDLDMWAEHSRHMLEVTHMVMLQD
jgi:hypothetical protein